MLAAKLVAMFVLLTAWDRVPTFNIEPACRYLADRVASPEEMKLCLSNEQAAREKLAKDGPRLLWKTRHIAPSWRQWAIRPTRIC